MAQAPRQIVGTTHSGLYSDGVGGSFKAPYGSPVIPTELFAPTDVVISGSGHTTLEITIGGSVSPNPDGTRYQIDATDTTDSSVVSVRTPQCDEGVMPAPFLVSGLVSTHVYNVVVKAVWGATLESSSVGANGEIEAPY